MVAPVANTQIEALFPVRVGVAQLIGGGDPSSLLTEELARTHAMGEGRRREFAAGRACARAAMGQLGEAQLTEDSSTAIATDGRSPIWPAGFVGSISHTGDYCVAVVGRVDEVGPVQLGIDVEQVGRVKPKLWRRVFVESERDQLAQRDDVERAATITFSVKEALYKAQYPVTKAWVGFEDVRVQWGNDRELVLHPETELGALDQLTWPVQGRWLEMDGRVITAVTLTPA